MPGLGAGSTLHCPPTPLSTRVRRALRHCRRMSPPPRPCPRTPSHRSSMKGHLGQALPGPPNGLADLESAGGPVASQGPTPHPAAPVPYGPTVPVCGPGRIGSSLHRPPGSYPEGCFDLLVGCSHTPTAPYRTYVLVPHTSHVRNCNLKTEQPA